MMSVLPNVMPNWILREAGLALVVIVGVTGGCADRSDRTVGVVEDSSGVTIIRAPEQSAIRWNVSEMPLAVLGADESQPAALLSGVRGVAPLRGGNIAVADRDRSIRLYGGDSRLLRRFGGWGEGPGEYREINLLRVIRGDTLVAFDPVTNRATFIAPDGESVRTIPVAAPGSFIIVQDITRDGRFIAVSGIPAEAENATAPGRWARATIVLIDPNEQVTDSIGSYLAFRCQDDIVKRCSPDHGAGPVRAFRGGVIAVNTDDNRLVGYNEEGEVDLIVHLGLSGSVREVVEDDAGGLWVDLVAEKSTDKQWLRVDLESGARLTIPVSDRLVLKDVVDASRVIAVHLDSLDVPTVRVIEIRP